MCSVVNAGVDELPRWAGWFIREVEKASKWPRNRGRVRPDGSLGVGLVEGIAGGAGGEELARPAAEEGAPGGVEHVPVRGVSDDGESELR